MLLFVMSILIIFSSFDMLTEVTKYLIMQIAYMIQYNIFVKFLKRIHFVTPSRKPDRTRPQSTPSFRRRKIKMASFMGPPSEEARAFKKNEIWLSGHVDVFFHQNYKSKTVVNPPIYTKLTYVLYKTAVMGMNILFQWIALAWFGFFTTTYIV